MTNIENEVNLNNILNISNKSNSLFFDKRCRKMSGCKALELVEVFHEK